MSARDKVEDMLSKVGSDYEKLAERAWKSGDQELIEYLLKVGFAKIDSHRRRKARQFIKENVIRTEFFSDKPLPKVKVKLPDSFRAKHIQRTVANIMTSWRIGGVELGKCTKDKLMTQARNERAAGKGHIENAIWYERLAAPMNDKETVASYWKDGKVIAFIRDEVLTDAAAGSNSRTQLTIEHRAET
jgi:hypothetical protein